MYQNPKKMQKKYYNQQKKQKIQLKKDIFVTHK